MNWEAKFTIIFGTVLFIAIGTFLVVFLLQYQKKKFQHFKELLNLKETFSHTLLRSQLEIQEQTLKNISQEIHDNIGQVLSLAKLNLATVDIEKIETLQQKIDDSKSLVAKAIQDLRDLSKSLNTDYVSDMGLARSIEYELEMIKKTGIIQTTFEIEGRVSKLEQQKELILFRIVQEVLNNILKHAKATSITIKLKYQTSYFFLKVTDNGQGFDLGKIQDRRDGKPGLGIKNLHNRAQLIGANFSMSSTLAQGTTVDISLPIQS